MTTSKNEAPSQVPVTLGRITYVVPKALAEQIVKLQLAKRSATAALAESRKRATAKLKQFQDEAEAKIVQLETHKTGLFRACLAYLGWHDRKPFASLYTAVHLTRRAIEQAGPEPDAGSPLAKLGPDGEYAPSNKSANLPSSQTVAQEIKP